jgi:hypothetical protein
MYIVLTPPKKNRKQGATRTTEDSMSATQKKATTKAAASKKNATAKPATKKAPTKKAPAKKAAPKKAPEAKDAGRSAGETLVRLIVRAEEKGAASAKVKTIATRLSEGETIKHAELATLRDEVNATASALRKQEEDSLAREFSMANRLVRRLERASR